jgi:fermentation-respiration switch protein FrsA (DUF1100 family)
VGLLGSVGLAYGLVLLAVVALEPRLLFPRPSVPDDELSRLAERWGATEVRLEAHDGTPLYGWRLGRGPRLALLFSGNGSTVGWQDERYRTLMDAGFSVLHMNYRGYPGSGGAPSEGALIDDAMVAWREALRSHDSREIVVFGKSLGGGVAIGLAEGLSRLPPGQQPAALVLESTFAAAWRVGANQYPFLPVRLLMRNRFESVTRAPHVTIPALVVHGGRDELIGVEQGAELAAALPDARFVEVPLGWHNDVLWDEPAARAALDEMLAD